MSRSLCRDLLINCTINKGRESDTHQDTWQNRYRIDWVLLICERWHICSLYLPQADKRRSIVNARKKNMIVSVVTTWIFLSALCMQCRSFMHLPEYATHGFFGDRFRLSHTWCKGIRDNILCLTFPCVHMLYLQVAVVSPRFVLPTLDCS